MHVGQEIMEILQLISALPAEGLSLPLWTKANASQKRTAGTEIMETCLLINVPLAMVIMFKPIYWDAQAQTPLIAWMDPSLFLLLRNAQIALLPNMPP